ncbi:flagellar biosynthetic protein FliO [Methylocapsa aurea]|uniref:flagellar biosynthetic protein FliO n=1 Tax=Methylocapsa aurea TaxID=663610 RepID=UPI00068B01EE|nr:flagellar biosynthetic protein FliO [Methylocapsa aurea]
MLALSDNIFENKPLMFIAAAIALLVAVALILLIFRLAVGHRLRMPRNGRARLPRLGIVDAFDLDRQRQLVIVRRDNVEHLIMIGGPNDLVIESEIIRAEIREGRMRDKEPREAAQGLAGGAWPSEFDAPRPPQPVSQPQRKTPFPTAPEPDAELTPAAAFDEAPSAPTVVAPAPRPPVFPLPPRRAPPASPPLPQRASPQREPSFGRSDFPQKPDGGANPSSGFPRAPLATPFLRPSPPRQLAADAAAKPTAPPIGAEAPAPISEPTPAAPPTARASTPAPTSEPAPVSPDAAQIELKAAEPKLAEPKVPELKAEVEAEPQSKSPLPEPAPAASVIGAEPLEGAAAAPVRDPIDSLEEEMAKLLGRGPGK